MHLIHTTLLCMSERIWRSLGSGHSSSFFSPATALHSNPDCVLHHIYEYLVSHSGLQYFLFLLHIAIGVLFKRISFQWILAEVSDAETKCRYQPTGKQMHENYCRPIGKEGKWDLSSQPSTALCGIKWQDVDVYEGLTEKRLCVIMCHATMSCERGWPLDTYKYTVNIDQKQLRNYCLLDGPGSLLPRTKRHFSCSHEYLIRRCFFYYYFALDG